MDKSNINAVRIFDIKYSLKDREIIKNDLDRILDEAFLSNHTYCRKLEAKLEELHKNHKFISCSSCTTALEAIFRYIDVKSKAVLVQSNTFIATGHAIQSAGGIIVPFDLNNDYTASLEDIHNAYSDCLNKNIEVSAVCVVNIAGRASKDLSDIADFCKIKKIPLVEDNAQGFLSLVNDKKLGTFADFSAYSFQTTKVVACGEGGAISCKNKDDLNNIRQFINFGRDIENPLLYNKISGNFKLSEISAAFILMDINRSNARIKRRTEIDKFYKENFINKDYLFYLNPPDSNYPSFYKTIMITNSKEMRSNIERVFKENNIAMTGYVYKIPLHKQPRIFDEKTFINRDLINTEKFCNFHITPPNYPELSDNQVENILNVLNKI